MLDEGADVFGRLLTELAVRDELPALFHCAAGKDRTGIAAALLLMVLGVDRDTVLADYDATNTYRTNRYIERIRPSYEEAGIDLDALRPVLRARPEVLDGALRWLAATHDDVETYLTISAHVQPKTLVTLRELLLE
jgi:protein-tyrosine phosphatase